MTHIHSRIIPRRVSSAAAITLAVSALWAVPAWAAPPTVTVTIAIDASRPTDWDKRIDEALSTTGSVENIAAKLAIQPLDTPAVLHAKVRVAIEQGDLATTLTDLKKAAQQEPANAAVLKKLAYVQELVSSSAAACKTLQSAAAAERDPEAAAGITLRLAAIALDEGRTADALALLDQVSACSPSAAGRAGIVAYLYGQPEAAAKYLHLSEKDQTTSNSALRLLEGNAALKSNQTELAVAAFDRAFEQADRTGDRLYAQERLLAASRQLGTLSALADKWSADPKLPADRMLPLATVLRELNRVPQLLTWWRAALNDPAREKIVLSDRFVHEVFGAAQSAGRTDDAVAICRELLARNPDDSRWLSATLQALLAAGHLDQADALLRTRIAGAVSDNDALEEIGRLARSLGRDAVAIEAAQKLVQFGGAPAIAGNLLEASIYQRAADQSKTIEQLNYAAATVLEHPIGLGRVVSAMETAGMDQDAVRLLQKSIQRDPSEDSLGRLASLLLKLDRSDEAIPVLEQLLQSGTTVATRSQAGNRLLEACSNTNAMPALIDWLKARLASNQSSGEELSLLVDAYQRIQQLDSAVQALETSKLLDDQTRLSRLAVLFLRSHRLDKAKETLTKLLVADPDDAIETLERIANVDLARNQPQEAAKTIRQIEERIGGGPTSSELMAGVLDRLDRPAEAATAYRRALAIKPDNADDWLLWSTALGKAKRGSLARHRLQMLCGEASNDNIFATAVDGLLNQEASGVALRVVRRDAILRAAERPQKAILYHVIADLSNEMQDASTVVRATEVSVSTSTNDEERSQHLRELMDVASQKNAIDTAVDCGQSLLALGDDFPPQLFLQLAEQLLVAGRLPDASRAIARASENADPEMVADRAAELFEKYGYPAAALDAMRPLADRRRNDANFRQSLGWLSGIAGDQNDAFDNLLAAAKVAVRDVAADKAPQHPRKGRGTGTNSAASGGFTQPTPAMEKFGAVMNSLLGAARTTDQQATVFQILRSAIDALIAGQDESPSKGLYVLATALRRASIAFSQPALADSIDAAIIRRWPNDGFQHDAFNARVQQGFITWAADFARTNNVPISSRLAAVLAPPPATQSAGLPLEEAAHQLPLLVARGDTELAHAVLNSLPVVIPPQQNQQMVRDPQSIPDVQCVMMAAVALGEQELANRWAMAWIDASAPAARQPKSSKVATRPVGEETAANASFSLPQVINAVWPLLDSAGRKEIGDRAMSQIDAWPAGPMRAQAIIRALQIEAAIDQKPSAARDLVAQVLGSPSFPIQSIGELLAVVPVNDRADLLKIALAHTMPTARLGMLEAFISQQSEPVDDATLVVLRESAQQMPVRQMPLWGDWCYNAAQKPALIALAEATVRTATAEENPDSPSPLQEYTPSALVAAATAYRVGGDSAKADETAKSAIEHLRIPPPPPAPMLAPAGPGMPGGPMPRLIMVNGAFQPLPPERTGLLRTAVAALSPDARRSMLHDIDVASKAAFVAQADVVWHSLIRSLLLDACGDRSEALAAAREGFAADPTNGDMLRILVDRLQDDGRWAEVAKVMTGHTGGTDDEADRARAISSRALNNLYRWREARVSASPDADEAPSGDLPARVANIDRNGIAASLRAQVASTYEKPSAEFVRFPSAGGLNGDREQAVPARANNADAFKSFDEGQWSGAVGDLLHAIQLPAENNAAGGEPSAWLVPVLAHLAERPDVYDQIVQALQPSVTSHTLTRRERQLAGAMMRIPGRTLPQVWVDELRVSALADSSGTELRSLARALSVQKDPSADAMLSWTDVIAKIPTPLRGRGSRTSIPSPGEVIDDGTTVGPLTLLCDSNPAAAEGALRSLRKSGRIGPRSIMLNMLWARCAAERGDMAAFATRLDDVLQCWNWQRIAPVVGPSIGTPVQVQLVAALPTQAGNSNLRDAIRLLADRLAAMAETWPSNTDGVRQLSAAASWAAEHDDQEGAELLFRQAMGLATRQGAGEQQLWVADLASVLGKGDVSISIQRALLEQRCLPAPRILPLLRALVSSGEADSAHHLAADVATYCGRLNLTEFQK